MVCSLDLESIAAKHEDAPYSQPTRWVKVENGAYSQYQDFLTLWKDADPDIPILKQAKAEYEKLK